MKALFIFAHPDDETVACAGTMSKLVQAGHEVSLVSVTDGGSGEVVSPDSQTRLLQFGSVGALRRDELQTVCEVLKIRNCDILDFVDGAITNQEVWGKLLLSLIEVMEKYQPNLVFTFDHTGWYYHLDHVAVSIATTLAVQKLNQPPDLFFHSLMPPHTAKWQYVYCKTLPVTHVVEITKFKETKALAMAAHQSQNLTFSKQLLAEFDQQFELYQLISQTTAGSEFLQSDFFQSLSSVSDNQVVQRLINCPE